MRPLTTRERAILSTLQNHPRQHPRRISRLAGLGESGRDDVGCRNTLRALERRGLARLVDWGVVGHDLWKITPEGQQQLAKPEGA